MLSPSLSPSAATDRLGAALALAERGFAVFPLRPESKVPAVRGDWEGLATADPARLRALGWPSGGNIGIACGPSGLFVLDLDVAKEPGSAAGSGSGSGSGYGPGSARDARPPQSDAPSADSQQDGDAPFDGLTVLRELAAGRLIPPTFTVATPSGGTHLYFRPPTMLRLRNTVARLGPLIDTRAAGGYVVAPGSVIQGRPYEIVEDAPIAPIPRWIVRELINRTRAALPPLPPVGRSAVAGPRQPGATAAAYGAAALRNETERVLAARVGTRNDTLNRAAYALGRLVGAGILDRDLAASELFHAARRAGLPARECASTVASGLGAGIARPRFPARTRPAVLAVRTSAAAPSNQVPPHDEHPLRGHAQAQDHDQAQDHRLERAGADPESRSTARDRESWLTAPDPEGRPTARERRDADILSALRAVDRAYDAAALCAAPLVFSRDWRRVRALADALRDLRDSPRPGVAEARRAVALCEAISTLASAAARDFPAPGRKRARSPLGNALRELSRRADAAVEVLTSSSRQPSNAG